MAEVEKGEPEGALRAPRSTFAACKKVLPSATERGMDMWPDTGRERSFLQPCTWLGIMLLLMGAVFLGAAGIIQIAPIAPEDVNLYLNGVRQPPTQETLRLFRLIFLACFGLVGAVAAAAGGIVTARASGRRKLALRLREEGGCLSAQAVECSPSVVRIFFRRLVYLRCAYTGPDGVTYVFKSDLLRMNPIPYLREGQVRVYYDRGDMSRYFVDVDGSVARNTRVVEL